MSVAMLPGSRRAIQPMLLSLFVFLIFCLTYQRLPTPGALSRPFGTAPSSASASSSPSSQDPNHNISAVVQGELYNTIISTSNYFKSYPLPTSAFGELARRTNTIVALLHQIDRLEPSLGPDMTLMLRSHLERTLAAQYTFLPAQDPLLHGLDFPLQRLRTRYRPGSKGIVIVAGKKQFRFAMHLIGNIRNGLQSTLPIQVAYAGDKDLPQEYRKAITDLGDHISTIDVLDHINDKDVDLRQGNWATKAFAMLASDFEKTILLDADAVFLQKPEALFETTGFKETGTILFHDRVLWKNGFPTRLAWFREQITKALNEPSSYLRDKSLMFRENWAEECDSGVVVLDKGRLQVLMGLLHICWQNTKPVREEWTWKMTYGDKESWWFGLELMGTPYAFEEHYGAVLGEEDLDTKKRKGVCSYNIAHVDETNKKLLWYNGSLLKNKSTNNTDMTILKKWSVDGEWVKGARKQDPSCIVGGKEQALDPESIKVLERSVEAAVRIDATLNSLLGDVNDCKNLIWGCL